MLLLSWKFYAPLKKKYFCTTVELVYNDNHWDFKIVAVVGKWSLLRGTF